MKETNAFIRAGMFFSLSAALMFSFPGGWGCGGSTTRASTSNELASAFPDDLAVASPTASSDSSSGLAAALGLKAQTSTAPIESFAEKKEDLEDLVNFGDEATFTDTLGEIKDEIDIFAAAPNASCYGPSLNYTDHPNAAGGEPNDGQLPSGDLGIWKTTESSTGEACCAAKMNNIIGEFETLINAGTKLAAATLGAASLDEALDELPDAGESLDMEEKADEVMAENSVPIDFDLATLEREEADTSDGDPVFVTEISGDLTLPDGTVAMDAALTHIPMDEEADGSISDETYCGRFVQSVNIPAAEVGLLGNCAGSDGITRCTLVEYCKESSTSLTYHLRTAGFCGMNKDCGSGSTAVDPSDKKIDSNTDGWGNNFFYTTCQVNPEDGTGSCAQCWQAGPLDGNTRCLNVVVNSDDTGRCYFGYGVDVASSTGVGAIDRMICNWAGPGNNHTGLSLAQRQLFSRDTTTGRFEPTSSNITYAPTNSCDKLASQATFTYTNAGDSSDTVAAGVVVTNNLIPLADVDFDVPVKPTVP